MSAPGLVHSCSGCNATLLFEPNRSTELQRANTTFGVYVFCESCQADEDKREAAVAIRPGTRCMHRGYPGGPFSDLYVISVEDDQVTVGVLALNGVLPERVAALEAAYWPFEMRGRRTFARSELRMKGL